jgi:RecJ-like exonuclease
LHPYLTACILLTSRLTEKVVGEQHDKALAKFKKFMETGMFKGGGKISNFDKLSAKVAKQYEGKPVKNQYQEEYGKYYSKEEAQEVGDKVAGKVKAMQTTKNMSGGQTSLKKTHSGAETLRKANALAKEIRKDGESWLDAKKRAFAQLKN